MLRPRSSSGLTISSPPLPGRGKSLRTRRKQRVLGIWVNTDARTFVDPPSYLAVLASHPLDAITDAENRRRLQLGIANTPLPELIHNDIGEVSNDPFRAALVQIMRERDLYSEEPNGVTFLTPTVFRATIALPAQVPTGNYTVDVKLFAERQSRHADGLKLPDRQIRLRAVRRQCRARSRSALRFCDCADGADNGLDRQRRVPAGLIHSHSRP